MNTPAHASSSVTLPAEWEPHEATWIAWPHHEPDWPGKLEAIHWVYADIVRVLSASERVEILCHDNATAERARACLNSTGVAESGYRLHEVPNDRSWLRDSAPTAVRTLDGLAWTRWRFNAWAKYDNYQRDQYVPQAVGRITDLPLLDAHRPDTGEPLVLEGGALDTDGQGTLLVTEECLLSDIQVRNPGLDRAGYERALAEFLGIGRVIWLAAGCDGDDTHGHIDDIARFVAPGKVVIAWEPDPADANHAPSVENLRRLEKAHDAAGRSLSVIKLPYPKPVVFEGERLPASYANFYIANRAVLVPTFNDSNDRIALETLGACFPDREIVGIHARDLVWGMGTLHCLTQQQPARA